ncbi:hypothetical protein N185_17275 [Sinorhizobium sp. GW3]|nr:hypothetical protein N185_17275 [Sinorhizobium sp. GW3]
MGDFRRQTELLGSVVLMIYLGPVRKPLTQCVKGWALQGILDCMLGARLQPLDEPQLNALSRLPDR